MPWQDLVEEKQERHQAAIPKEWLLSNPPDDAVLDVTGIPDTCGVLSNEEIEISNTPVKTLLEKLQTGQWSAVQVTTAFLKRAIVAQQLVNCLTEIFVQRALDRAKALDATFKESGKPTGPLHGLPISLKDQINIEGLESTMGYVSWIGKYAKQNAVLVDVLENAGAVIIAKTNIPQTLMWPETYNHIFGRTVNPHNRNLTCGGSSGGEGALVAMLGSAIGVGSDIGGSVRIPAAMCGTYGLKPSYGRIPYSGCVNSMEGQDSVLSALGPLSNSVEGLKVFTKAVVDQKPWFKDPLAVRKPWNEDEYTLIEHGNGSKLCFGIIWDDGSTKPNPPIQRGLEITKKALEAAGHKVIEWVPLKHAEINANISKIWAAGATEDYKVVTAETGEPVIGSMVPDQVFAESIAYGESFRPKEGISAYELWQVQSKRKALREEYLKHWESTVERTGTGRPVDAIISPAAPYVAPLHGAYRIVDYTMVWNSLDYTAAIIPVSKVDPKLDTKQPPHVFYNKADELNYESYDPETFKNAPISIQLIGRTLEEEAVLGMAEIVDAAVNAKSV